MILFRVCKKYQRCSKCVALDTADTLTNNGDICDWETSRYEISFNANLNRMDCSSDASDGLCGMAQCKENVFNFFISQLLTIAH